MDKRNPKQTCALCAYFKFDEWGDACCYFPLSPTEEPDGYKVGLHESCKEWKYFEMGGEIKHKRDRMQRLEEKVHGLEQVIVELITAVGLEP